MLSPSAPALADSYDDQINALKAKVAADQSQAASMRTQANDARTKIAQLQAGIRVLNDQIYLSTLESNRLSAQIAQTERDMADKKATLAQNIKSIYVNGNITPLEMIASSKNLSEYFNQQQYQDKIKTAIESSMASIKSLQAELTVKKTELEQKLVNQRAQKAQAAQQEQEAQDLLALAESNAAAADAQVKNSNSQITKLKAQQAAELAARYANSGLTSGGTCGGGYPARWCNAPQDSLVDSWGMYNRECVSYAAFKVAASGRFMPYWGGRGNAWQWAFSRPWTGMPGNNAQNAGIPVDSSPRPGDIAISNVGEYGHAMYVEAVLDSSIIHISQYNFGGNGEYSEMTISTSGLRFIHF